MKSSSKNLTRQTLALFWQHAWRHKIYVLLLMLVTPLASLTFRFLPPLIAADILDRISKGDFVRGQIWQSFGPDLVLYGFISILGGIFLWRVVVLLIWELEMRVAQDLYQRMFAHLMTLSAQFHANRFGGSLVSQTNKLVSSYVRMADTTVFQLSGLIFSFIFTAIILAPRAPLVTLMLFVFSVLFIGIAAHITRKIRVLHAQEAAAANRQTGYLADAITNVMAIKSFAGETHENTRFAGATQDTRDITRKVLKAATMRDLFFSGSTAWITITSLVAAVASVVLFEAEVATVFLVFTYSGIVTQNLWEFSQSTLRNYNRALADARDMVEILAIKPSVEDPQTPEPNRIDRGAITFQDVVFTHGDANDALFKKLNIQVAAGEKIGLVGHSGSGKTTLTRLLLRFSDIDGGEILIDGQNIAHMTQHNLRSHIAYVPQEPLLFHRSLAENIAYGRPKASLKDIKAVAKLAHADEFIDKLPEGYKTLVGERGVKLSGGQRQRVAIARAMLKNAPILLLDEATSALDSESERLIQDALWKLMEGRTAIVIAHRLSTIQKMDRILVMEKGMIVEQGSHKELLAKKGVYADLWAHQSGGFLEE